MTKKSAKSSPETETVAERELRPITLITTGFRGRLQNDEKPIVTLDNAKFGNTAELAAIWAKRITAVKVADYVPGSGEGGLFSERFAKQVVQITDLEHVWCPTNGLGLVCLDAEYPNYSLGDGEDSMTKILPEIDEAKWWDHVTETSGNSFTEVIKEAITAGHRVLVAIPGTYMHAYRNDLTKLLDEVELPLLQKHLRFLGPQLEHTLPTKLLPCLMPYDKEALDLLVPGSKSHSTKRLAFLYLKLFGSKKTTSSPLNDYKTMEAAFTDGHEEAPFTYETPSAKASSRRTLTKLTDEEAAKKVAHYAKTAGEIPARIMRMMREDGFSITTTRVEELLAETVEDAPKAEKSKARKKG